MIRELSIGNDHLLVGFDQRYQLSELYCPRFRSVNLVADRPGRLGMTDRSRLFWTTDPSWRIRPRYLKETLTSSVSLANNRLQVVCRCCEAVDLDRPILVRQISVRNLVDYGRRIGILYYQDFQSDPGSIVATRCDERFKGLIHRTDRRYLFCGFWADVAPADVATAAGATVADMLDAFDEHPPDLTEARDHANQPSGAMAKIDMDLTGFAEQHVYFVLALARDSNELTELLDVVKANGPQAVLDRSSAYWRLWVTGANINFANLPARVIDLCKRSLLTLRTCMHTPGLSDDRPIVPAGLLVHAFSLAGLPEPSRWLLRLARRSLNQSGDPDLRASDLKERLSSGSDSWHPAGSAILLWSLWRHFFRYRDIEFVRSFWETMVRPLANGLCGLYDEYLGMLTPPRDLWNRGRGLDAFTVAAVYGGLVSAKNFAICFGDRAGAERYGPAAEKIKLAVEHKFFDERTGRFAAVLWFDDPGGYRLDPVCDVAVFGLVKFAMFPATDERITSTMAAVAEKLWVNTPIAGLTRFEGDQQGPTAGIPGRPSTVATTWLAQYLTARARNVDELKQALPILQWAVDNAGPAGLLAGTLHPTDPNQRAGQADLWAHAEFVIAVIEYLEKLEQLQTCPACGQSIYRMRRHWPMQVKLEDLLARYTDHERSDTPRTDNVVMFEHEGQEVTLAIDTRECLGCGMCTINCRHNVIVIADDKAAIDVNNLCQCNLCRECIICCPVKAIEITCRPTSPAHGS